MMPYSVDLDEFSPLVREYIRYKHTIQGCSQKTSDEYLLDLRTFMRFLISDKDKIPPDSEEFAKIDISGCGIEFFRNVSTGDIYSFLMFASDVRYNNHTTVARKLSSVKGFFKYLTAKMHYLESNPSIDIETPKIKKSLPKFLTLEESLHLLDTVKSDTESKNVLRDYTIITLFLNCGMRVSELIGINMRDISPDLSSMRVVGKGAKERIIYLNEACRAVLEEYIPFRKTSDRYKTVTVDALFLSSRCQRMSVKTVQWMVYKYLDAAGYGARHLSVHKLRHTAATLMYQSGGVDVRVLKDILGHEQLNTTQIYTHVSDAGMREAMEQNPLAKIKPE